MDYQAIYDRLVLKRKLYPAVEGYTEKHHILPKSMGGGNSKSNLVVLTAREHYVAHHLLWRIHRNRSMAFAWNMMAIQTHGRGSDKYAKHRELRSKAMSESSKGANGHFYGKHHTDEVKAYLRSINLGNVVPQHVRDKISAGNKGVPKGPMSDATKKKLSIAHTGKVLSGSHRDALSKAHIGRIHTPTSIEAMRQAKLGVPRSAETKAKLSKAHMGKVLSDEHKANISKSSVCKKKVRCIETGVEYSSIIEAVNTLHYPLHAKGGISQVCLGHRKKARGLSWEFITES